MGESRYPTKQTPTPGVHHAPPSKKCDRLIPKEEAKEGEYLRNATAKEKREGAARQNSRRASNEGVKLDQGKTQHRRCNKSKIANHRKRKRRSTPPNPKKKGPESKKSKRRTQMTPQIRKKQPSLCTGTMNRDPLRRHGFQEDRGVSAKSFLAEGWIGRASTYSSSRRGSTREKSETEGNQP